MTNIQLTAKNLVEFIKDIKANKFTVTATEYKALLQASYQNIEHVTLSINPDTGDVIAVHPFIQ